MKSDLMLTGIEQIKNGLGRKCAAAEKDIRTRAGLVQQSQHRSELSKETQCGNLRKEEIRTHPAQEVARQRQPPVRPINVESNNEGHNIWAVNGRQMHVPSYHRDRCIPS